MNTRPVNLPDRPDLHPVVNYTIVALIGMLAGIIVGYVFGYGAKGVSNEAAPPSLPHPRALEPKNP